MTPHILPKLRESLVKEGAQGCLITGTDPHRSEYVPQRWETRAFISGFTGSAGTLVITLEKAALWTDSRYFLQAETELAGSGIILMKMDTPGCPSPQDWVRETLGSQGVFLLDGSTTPLATTQAWKQSLEPKISVKPGKDLLEEIWADRPPLPGLPLWDLESAFRGLSSRRDKLQKLRTELTRRGAGAHLMASLDDIAWLTNLRGEDIEYNPIFLAFALVEDQSARLFVEPTGVNTALASRLEADGWTLENYERIIPFLKTLPSQIKILLDPQTTNTALAEALGSRHIIQGTSPIPLWKARKEPAELDGIRTAHKRDALALLRFIKWFEETAPQNKHTEGFCAAQLRKFRALGENYLGDSFETIPGWGKNGAIVHYGLGDSPGDTLTGPGLFLLDSGAQYLEGTTDVTRTLALGTPTPLQKEDYTLVLKAHLALGRIPFPQGTRGYQLDALARTRLWAKGRNYGHGTGHGVGHVLCVHEGPQRLGPAPLDQCLEPGMVVSNEPGLYRTGEYGIRIENLQAVIPGFSSDFGEFLGWETMTLVPYSLELIDPGLLDQEESQQIISYHSLILQVLSQDLKEEERKWLEALEARTRTLLGPKNGTGSP